MARFSVESQAPPPRARSLPVPVSAVVPPGRCPGLVSAMNIESCQSGSFGWAILQPDFLQSSFQEAAEFLLWRDSRNVHESTQQVLGYSGGLNSVDYFNYCKTVCCLTEDGR